MPADAQALVLYRSLPEVARYQSWEAFDLADAGRLATGQAGLAPGTPGTWFQVAVADGGVVIGDCGLHCRADDPRQFEVGATFDPAYQGRGYATEALTALLTYTFAVLGAHRVTATTDAENGRAAALFARLGFRREGHFLRNVWFKGRWGDEFLFAVLRDEWHRPRGASAAGTR